VTQFIDQSVRIIFVFSHFVSTVTALSRRTASVMKAIPAPVLAIAVAKRHRGRMQHQILDNLGIS
jgi:hypothetical protein